MVALELFQGFLERSRRETSVESLADCFGTTVQAAGITEFLVCSLCDLSNRPPDTIWINRYSPDWTTNYLAHRYCEIDPIFAAAATARLPFLWDEILEPRILTAQQKRLFADAREFGHGFGMTVPIRTLDHYPACVALASERPFDPSLRHELHLVSLYMFDAARRFNLAQTPRHDLLTPREVECLRWAAVGKSNWDIGIILHISEATVRFHLENVRRKYGVGTTAQAVARATLMGLLTI